jgi:hypothetical protein
LACVNQTAAHHRVKSVELHCKLFAVGAKTIMKFIVAIEPGDADHSFGVVVPDLPGCFSAG